MLVAHYDVNFLFVVSRYARNNASQKREWRGKVHTIFLVEAGASNKLKAVLQVEYLQQFSSFTDLLAFNDGTTDGSKLKGVLTGGKGSHWLWRIVNWVDI